jgi:hypothetical protein
VQRIEAEKKLTRCRVVLRNLPLGNLRFISGDRSGISLSFLPILQFVSLIHVSFELLRVKQQKGAGESFEWEAEENARDNLIHRFAGYNMACCIPG